jgi:uncharacterized membrane protein YraQ (UPF0718 family)
LKVNGALLTMVAVLVALTAIAWTRGGEALVREGMGKGVGLLLEFALILVISFLAAGLATVLVPAEWIQASLGAESGVRGIAIAAGVGVVTPAGPFVAMPLAAVMLRSGAAVGPVVAFLTAWSLLAVHRLIAWEIPIVGAGVALLRYGICLFVPILVGLLARWLVDLSDR